MTFPMARIFARIAEPATYTPPAGTAAAVWAKRIDGGRAERIGPVTVVVEDMTVHVLRSQVIAPVSGATVVVAGQTWTVGAWEPLEKDPEQNRWALRLTWGGAATWTRPGNDGGTLRQIASPDVDYTAEAALSGASAITISASAWPDGWVRAGDQITVGGGIYTATADVEPGYSAGYLFSAVSITPVSAGALSGGEAVTIAAPSGAPGAQTVQAAIADYSADEIMGGVLTGDRRLVVRADDFDGTPTTSDIVTIDGDDWTVVSVEAVYSGASVAVWVAQVRR